MKTEIDKMTNKKTLDEILVSVILISSILMSMIGIINLTLGWGLYIFTLWILSINVGMFLTEFKYKYHKEERN